jgi:hypothetical protein
MTMTEPPALPVTEVTTLAGTAHANTLYPADAPLIRIRASGQPDPVSAAIARHISKSGSVFVELPGGQLTIVLRLDGKTWIARHSNEGTRG